MQLTIFKTQLSFGMQGDDVARLQSAMLALGVNIPLGERNQDRGPVMGEGTVAALKGLQAELGLAATGVADGATVRAINEKLATQATAPGMVRGSVRDADGDPAHSVTVEIFIQGPAGEQHLGVSRVDAGDGSYAVSYRPPSNRSAPNGRIDLRIEVQNSRGPVETVPSGASILTDAGLLEVVDFVLSGKANPPSTELDLIVRDLSPLLGGRNFADLQEDETRHDVSLLASQSGYSPEQVAALVLAHKLAKGSQTPVPLFYGLFRNGQPANLLALQALHPRTRLQALQAAVRQGVVPAEIGGRKIEEFLPGLASPSASRLERLFGRILDANDLDNFLVQYLQSSQDPTAFWERLASDPVFTTRAPRLRLAAQAEALTGHQPLSDLLLSMPGVKEASDLTRLTEENWKALIQTQGVGVPAGTPGTNDAEKARTYARQLVHQVEAAFPTQFLAHRLGPTPIGTFLDSQRSFNVRTTYLDQYLKKNPDAAQRLTPQDRNELRTLQRLSRLTNSARETTGDISSAEEITALARQGLRSASQIAQMDRGAFARQTGEIFSEARAKEVHERARRTHATALALFGEHGASLNRTGLQALPKLNTALQAIEAGDDSAEKGIPDWETLFGGFDLCACQECSSVHGPAAYFVDILSFLGERRADETSDRRVRGVLFDRRPDLGDIELSCENTNTVLPLIDLVNEVLENAVSPPPPFAPLTLSPALEADLGQRVATPELAAAFNPPLRSASAVETLETGKRWRIRDEPFAYSVVKEDDVLLAVGRSRQTAGSAQERRATPQYRNSAAYDELSRAVHPWGLPFDLPAAEANLFLTHLGVARRDLIEALRPTPEPFDPTFPVVVRLASERLGLTDTERRIIVDASLVTPHLPEDFWGGASVTALSTVQELLDKSALTYVELEALIATWFINPTATLVISARPGEPVATCALAKLQIDGLTQDGLSRIHRFVRLWRKLGWSMGEVDQSIRAFAPETDAPSLTDEILVRLDHLSAARSRLRLSIAQTLSLWKPIDTSGPGSLYARLFYNPAVFKPQDEAFRLGSDGKKLVHSDELLTAHAAALQAVFRLNSPSFALLAGKTDGKLTLANLSLLHRHAILARQIGLSVEDLLTAIDLTGIDPFLADRTQDTLRFVDVVTAIGKSELDLPQLDYLVRHRFNRASAFVPAESILAQTLTDLRAELLRIKAESDLKEKHLRETVAEDDLPAALAALTGEQNKLRKSAAIDRVSGALAIPADVTGDLLQRVSHGSESALQRFLALSGIPDDALPLSRNVNAGHQFESLEKLLKIAMILRTLKLPGSQLPWLFRETAASDDSWLAGPTDPPASAVAFASWFPLVQLQQIRRDLSLEDAALEAILGATNAIAAAADDSSRLAARSTFLNALSRWLGWPQGDLETLIGKADVPDDRGLLKARFPEDYRLDLIVRLERAMRLLKRLGVTAAEASEWCEAVVTDIDAKAIRRAAKAKYDDASWLKIATPLQDSLRDEQRAALVTYLAARPAQWTTNLAKADANDLYSYFLIDVEMSSCQLTSRIKQAIGSVQLFAQRCLMGLEPDVRITDGKWEQWEWMKNFRVWEANRKIWLYPENWIEPELRDDKSPFFQDLENELLQSDLDDAAAEQALQHYLEKLDEVANLQIVGVYEDDRDKSLHVFGRTHHTPHIYYYRCRDTTKTWKPWQKVDLDIEGDHLIPVVWNDVLTLIWVIFNEKAEEKEVQMPAPRETLRSADRHWEFQLAWSEYQHGKWSGKNLSESITLQAYQDEDNVLFGRRRNPGNSVAIAALAVSGSQGADGGNGGGSGGTISFPERPASRGPRKPVPEEQIRFQAFALDAVLKLRGSLRRDYRSAPETGDSQIGCVFGEIRFSGCRKIMSIVDRSQIARLDFALAPSGTKFDGMGFTGTDSGLVLFDGRFQAAPAPDQLVIGIHGNEPASIAGNPKPTTEEKHSIHVLSRGPSTFQLLVPHQDVQFVANRPFFYMDSSRTFMVTSTGSSGTRSRPDVAAWVQGNLATTRSADFSLPPELLPSDETVSTANASLTILAPGPGGRRTSIPMVPVRLTSEFRSAVPVPTFYTTRQYRFSTFHHPFLCAFETTLHREGVGALLSLQTQRMLESQSFESLYGPEAPVLKEYPQDEVEFRSGGAYELYNWELFFHIPLLIADRLRANQRFNEAQRWFHYIFDPTGVSGGAIPQRYWNFKPANERQAADYEAQSVKTIEEMLAKGVSEELTVAVDTWRANPFNPHAVARLRTTAYQKTVVMKYIDNLIDWGDQLFRRETLESINEATQLYVLAAEILGRRPEVIERDLNPPARTFNTLKLAPGGLSNALEQIELLVRDVGDPPAEAASSPPPPDPPSDTVLYFCVPENDQLLGYWTTVADRLFKIRHCMNIEGQVRQLALFEPPIDPALLVRARAAGLSISEVLSDIADVSLPNYRFSFMVQKANEVVAELRNLGAGLLSVLEKRDAEALSTLRAGQELRLLQAVRDIRTKQIAEAEANIEALQKGREMAQARKDYYESREFISPLETIALTLSYLAQVPMGTKAESEGLSVVVNLFPDVKTGAPTSVGVTIGGSNKGASGEAHGRLMETVAAIMNMESLAIGRMAEYTRRQDEWSLQSQLATKELKQIDQQLAAAEIRLAMAEQELRNHDQQIDNARETDQFLRGKFTNQDLYQYMIGRVSGLYFQSYQLAYDLAKRAERCMQHELGLRYGETSFIRFGYWDSLKKGLLAGDHLAHDLKRLEIAYLDGNVREYELTRHVSLVSLEPEQFLELKKKGVCEFEVPEWLFDLDTPGHFMRRLKNVSLTIPCVTGPYTGVHCTLRLIESSYRRNTGLEPAYDRRPADDTGGSDDRFVDDRRVLDAIVTSTGQNDAGLFEPSMRDERYLPFEGAGARSRWQLELPVTFQTFDYSTISDVILHLRYTARDGGNALSKAATDALKARLNTEDPQPLMRLFSLRHEFPSEWHRFISSPMSPVNRMTVELAATRFPHFVQSRTITVGRAAVIATTKPGTAQAAVAPGEAPPPDLTQSMWTGQGSPGRWTIATDSDPKLLEDIILILAYRAG
ncbi:MAG: hypothetical protein QOK37_1604 [Thermoanaerobaculia bacterium]|jgi:hypothetical protein|nr:hypothetical protein [Thermoanaerobaculia bacterium]